LHIVTICDLSLLRYLDPARCMNVGGFAAGEAKIMHGPRLRRAPTQPNSDPH
jgi:hypothetical protein